MNNNKKILLSVLVVVLIIALVVSGTYAVYKWHSTYGLNVSISVTDHIIITFDGGTDITGRIKPVVSPELGIVKHMTIKSNLPSSSNTYGIYLKTNDLPNVLKDDDFKWLIIDCDLEDNCNIQDAEIYEYGDFSTSSMSDYTDSVTGDLLLLESSSMPFRYTQDLYLYLWIDGTVDNDPSLGGNEIDFDIYAKGTTINNGSLTEVEHEQEGE